MKVKICGLRDLAAARAAVEAGADYVGFVFAPTRRYVRPEVVSSIVHVLPGSVGKVGLFVNEHPETIRSIVSQCGLDYVQLCGKETPDYCRSLGVPVVKSLPVRGAAFANELDQYLDVAEWCVLDGFRPNAHGGTGQTFDWALAEAVVDRGRIMVAGGLTPENVGEAIRIARPWGVDVSSGVETDGQKDVTKIAAFVAAARRGGA
ncbi:MAG TPA: phosphoribosylanthranilate isomerase [Chloroflexota bacterium]|nr:phosphoribosylanthranilate isomerase [Chloroflexota bacterium]